MPKPTFDCKVTLTHVISQKLARNVLELALDADWIKGITPRSPTRNTKLLDVPFEEGGRLAITHASIERDRNTFTDLDLEGIKRGFQMLADNNPSTLGDMLDPDAILEPGDADLWLQARALG